MNVKRKSSSNISPDPDLPEITDDWIAGADLYHGDKLVRRGRPKLESPRQLLSLRLPPQVIACWKASGPGWQDPHGRSSREVRTWTARSRLTILMSRSLESWLVMPDARDPWRARQSINLKRVGKLDMATT